VAVPRTRTIRLSETSTWTCRRSPLYSFAYDQKEGLWKIIWHNKRWSEDDPSWYPAGGRAEADGPEGGLRHDRERPDGTGNRIEFWDVSGTPLPSKGKVLTSASAA
jgi:hypothetical protein